MITCRGVGAALASALVVVVLGGCADDGNDLAAGGWTSFPAASTPPVEDPAPDDEPAVPETGVVVPVIALDNSFRPERIEISVGDEILWENRGMNEHDVLHVEGDAWGVEVEQFQPGDVYRHVFTEPGEYRYYCSIHGNADVGMIGTVVVTG